MFIPIYYERTENPESSIQVSTMTTYLITNRLEKRIEARHFAAHKYRFLLHDFTC